MSHTAVSDSKTLVAKPSSSSSSSIVSESTNSRTRSKPSISNFAGPTGVVSQQQQQQLHQHQRRNPSNDGSSSGTRASPSSSNRRYHTSSNVVVSTVPAGDNKSPSTRLRMETSSSSSSSSSSLSNQNAIPNNNNTFRVKGGSSILGGKSLPVIIPEKMKNPLLADNITIEDLTSRINLQEQQQPSKKQEDSLNSFSSESSFAVVAGPSSDDPGKLFIGGLLPTTNAEMLRKSFEIHGKVKDAVVMCDKITLQSRCFGFVSFEDASIATKLAGTLINVDGRVIKVKSAIHRSTSTSTSSIQHQPTIPNQGSQNHARTQILIEPQQQQQPVSINSSSTRENIYNIIPEVSTTHFEEQRSSVSDGGSTGASTPEVSMMPTRKIFVGGLASSVTEQDLVAYFGAFGEIQDSSVMYDRETRRSRGFGFVTFVQSETVDIVMQNSNHVIFEKWVEVKRAESREAMLSKSRTGSVTSSGSGGSYAGGPNPISSGTTGRSRSPYQQQQQQQQHQSQQQRGLSPPHFHPGYMNGMNISAAQLMHRYNPYPIDPMSRSFRQQLQRASGGVVVVESKGNTTSPLATPQTIPTPQIAVTNNTNTAAQAMNSKVFNPYDYNPNMMYMSGGGGYYNPYAYTGPQNPIRPGVSNQPLHSSSPGLESGAVSATNNTSATSTTTTTTTTATTTSVSDSGATNHATNTEMNSNKDNNTTNMVPILTQEQQQEIFMQQMQQQQQMYMEQYVDPSMLAAGQWIQLPSGEWVFQTQMVDMNSPTLSPMQWTGSPVMNAADYAEVDYYQQEQQYYHQMMMAAQGYYPQQHQHLQQQQQHHHHQQQNFVEPGTPIVHSISTPPINSTTSTKE